MANFTPQEIEEMLQEFFDVVGKRQYVGARYVPIFGRKNESSIEWDNSAPYEPLTIVLHQGNSYTSRTYVPTGIAITDTTYWANTGNYNAQVEAYRRETATVKEQIDATDALIPKASFNETNTVKKYIDDKILEKLTYVENHADLLSSTEDYVCVLHNDSAYGDGGICFFEKTTEVLGTTERNDGTFVTPIPMLSNIGNATAPMDSIIRCAETYIGKSSLVYGNVHTLFDSSVTNQIDCSSFVQALMEGITYDNSRYSRGTNNANIQGPYIGEYFSPDIRPEGRLRTWEMAQFFLEHKSFYKFNGDAKSDLTRIKAGDILFSTSRTVSSENRLMDIDHCMLVLDVYPNDGSILVIQAGAAPSNISNMQTTVCKISLIDFIHYDNPNNAARPSYVGFARLSYGMGSVSSDENVVNFFKSFGTVNVDPEGVSETLATVRTKQALKSFSAYTIMCEGLLPKFDVDGCWLVASIVTSGGQSFNIARWYRISIFENYAKMTFITPDLGQNSVDSIIVRVITENQTEFANAFRIDKFGMFRGFSTSESLQHALTFDATNLDSDLALRYSFASINDDGSLNLCLILDFIGESIASPHEFTLGAISGDSSIYSYRYNRFVVPIAGFETGIVTITDAGVVKITTVSTIYNNQRIYISEHNIGREIA